MKKTLLFCLALALAAFCADSLNVRLLGRYTPCSPTDIITEGDVAYVANSSGGLMILDVTDPSSMSSPGYLFLSGEASSIDRIGDYVSLTCSDSTIQILDPSDPGDIGIVGEYYSSFSLENCIVIGDTIYANGGGFVILDAGDPFSISLIGEYSSVFAAEDLFIKPPYAFLAEDNYGLSILDITAPSTPLSFERYFGLEEYIRSIYVDRWNRLFIGTDEEMMIYRLSGDSIQHLGSWTSPSPVLDIEVDGIYAFLACGNQGLRILDISETSSITEAGYYVLGSEMTELHLDYPRIWTVGVRARVNCFDITPFADVEEDIAKPVIKTLSASPSPFNSSCRIEGSTSQAVIYDIRGARVADIEVPGVWKPDDDLPSGIYLVQPTGSGDFSACRVILMR